jgi:hypothetical protein
VALLKLKVEIVDRKMVELMKIKLLKSIVLAAATVLFAVGCDVEVKPPGTEVQVAAAPPPAQVEVETPAPGADFVWIGGAWVWGPGGSWGWQGGHWDRPPHAGAVWVPHRYDTGKHVFVRGGWR